MTQYWDILNNGQLAVWTHDQDPQTDDPTQTSTDWGRNGDGLSWSGEHPDEVYDMLEAEWDKGVPNQANGLTARSAQLQMDLIQHLRGDDRIERRN